MGKQMASRGWAGRVRDIDQLTQDAATIVTQRKQLQIEKQECSTWVYGTLSPYTEVLKDLYKCWQAVTGKKSPNIQDNCFKAEIKVDGKRLQVRGGDICGIWLGDTNLLTFATSAHMNWIIANLKTLEDALQDLLDQKTAEVKEVIRSEKGRIRQEAELLDPIRVLLKMKEAK